MLRADRLQELLHYDPVLGLFRWNVTQGRAVVGMVAGNRRPDGYSYIKIDKRLYRSTRLAWLYTYDEWPKGHVDHINGNTSDDRLVNLRDATRSQNLGNRRLNKNSTSGFKGVSFRNGRFRAYINKDGKRIYLGGFSTAEEAGAAYMAAAKVAFGEFARLR